MDSNPGVPSPQPSAGRKKRRAIVVFAALALTLAAVAGTHTISAEALPPTCDGGPCPPPDTDPSTTPTTSTPPPITWTARVTVLDQTPDPGFNRTVSGSWGRTGSPSYTTPSGSVVWDVTKDPQKRDGTLGITSTYLPPGNVVGFRMLESQSSGRLCRSLPAGSVPPSGRTVHVLVAASQFTTASQLNDMASNIRGTYHPDGDTTITVQKASLQPLDTGLSLTISGTLFNDVQWPLPNVDATFTYTTLLHLHPSTSIADPNEVMTVSADQGDLHLQGDGWTDDAEIWWNGNVEPQFRSNVAVQATQAVNNAVSAKAQTQWFRSLGYTVSVRSLSTSATGLTVWPSLCKVD